MVHINLAHKVFISRLVDYTVLPQTQYVSRQQGRLVSSVRARWNLSRDQVHLLIIVVELPIVINVLMTCNSKLSTSSLCTYVCNQFCNEFALHCMCTGLPCISSAGPLISAGRLDYEVCTHLHFGSFTSKTYIKLLTCLFRGLASTWSSRSALIIIHRNSFI